MFVFEYGLGKVGFKFHQRAINDLAKRRGVDCIDIFLAFARGKGLM